MYKKGDCLQVQASEMPGGCEYLMFVEDAVPVHGNPLKYMGAARPVCEAYLDLQGRPEQRLYCKDCRHGCPKRRYMIKYVGPFASAADEEDAQTAGTCDGSTTVNQELETLLGRRRAKTAPAAAAAKHLDRLEREQALLARQASVQFVSPFLMRTYAGGRSRCGGVPVDYVVLEYVEGKELREYIAILKNMQDQREADRRRGDLMRQLLYAVRAYAKQDRGVYYVHRDLKPENLMVYTYGENKDYQQLKILDFEMLVAQRHLQAEDLYMGGTRGYVHPEAYRMAALPDDPDRQFSHRWDLYAVGLMMYEIMEGHPHFEDDAYLEDRTLAYTLKPMESCRYRPELASIIRRLITDDNSRYEDIDQVIEDYQRFLEKDNSSWYRDTYMDHWLECLPGYEQELRFVNVYCRISCDGFKDCRKNFCVTENTALMLDYGRNVVGCEDVMGSQPGRERGGQKIIGAFYYMDDRIRFMPLAQACSMMASETENGIADIMEGDQIRYKNVAIYVEKVEYYD